MNARGGSRECGLWVRQSSSNFARLCQSSREGAHMLLVYAGTRLHNSCSFQADSHWPLRGMVFFVTSEHLSLIATLCLVTSFRLLHGFPEALVALAKTTFVPLMCP